MTNSEKTDKGGVPRIDLGDEEFQREFLRGVEELMVEAGEWKVHLPYEAIMLFDQDASIHDHYAEHVISCWYCRELLDVLRPTR